MAASAEPWIRRYYPDLVRVVGLVLGVVLVLAPVVSDVSPSEVAGGYPLCIGMIFFKTVRDAVRNGNGAGGG